MAKLERACALLFAVLATILILPAQAQVHTSPNDGPGLGNLTYTTGELFTTLSRIAAPPTTPRQGPGNVDMVNGYLMVLTESDGGGTANSAAIEFWNVGNPRLPFRVVRHNNADTFGNRENHGFGLSSSYPGDYLVVQGHNGLLFWDVTDPLNVRLLKYLALPGIAAGDYSGAWWSFWQAPYVYVAGQGSGLYVVDATDPSNPVLVRRMLTSEIGGFNIGIAQAIGNLLVVAGSQSNGHRQATLDISDPVNPRVLNVYNHGNTKRGYSMMVAGGKVYTSGGDGGLVQMHSYNLTHDGVITPHQSAGPLPGTGNFENGGYASVQSGFVFSGFSNRAAKFKIDPVRTAVGQAASGNAGDDEDFAVALGNVMFVGDDHGTGSTIVAHQAEPDTIAPWIEWVHPADESVNQAVTSRVGVSVSEIFDLDSANATTFIVRPVGGSAISGKYSKQHHLLNFSPDQPLLANTTYEVIIEGLRDYGGNVGGRFTSTFKTGAQLAVTGLTYAGGTTAPLGAVGRFTNGVPLYADRIQSGTQFFVRTPYPASFEGRTYILTRNDDKQGTAIDSVRFDLHYDAMVYVLLDPRVPVPSWLSSWTATGEVVTTSDAAAPTRIVFSKSFPIGPVVLGGNESPTANASMYNVVVIPVAESLPDCTLNAPGPITVGSAGSFSATGTGGSVRYSWDFGDGSPHTALSPTPGATHAYSQPGRYSVVLNVSNNAGTGSCTVTQVVHHPLTALPSKASSTIAYGNGIVYAVNADNDSVTAVDAATLLARWEVVTGTHPRTVAIAPNGDVWVVNQDDASISVLHPVTGAGLGTHLLPRATQPYGVVFSGDKAYVTLHATGELARLGLTGAIEARVAVGPKPRGIAISGDGSRILVSQFVSKGTTGKVREVSGATFEVVRTFELAFDPEEDSSVGGRGAPNYLTSLTISPDGRSVAVPSKKDNLARGQIRDGQDLTFETMVRAIVSEIDLVANAENLVARIDINDRAMPQAAIYSPFGDVLLVSTQGTNTVEFFDAHSGNTLGNAQTGRAPQGMVFSPDASRLFVHNFMGRSVSVFDSTDLVAGRSNATPLLAEVATISVEKLAPEIVQGKRIFYNAADTRMSRDQYISCASCHLDGGSDEQVWDFRQVGEGFRNTINLTGKAGMKHGRVHWTANFDEIQDFENDIRHFAGGTGFLSDTVFAATASPLGAPKSGYSADLDALAAYVTSLDTFPPSPYRHADPANGGSSPSDVELGRRTFVRSCMSCHAGDNFTDGKRWDVGTIKPTSGLGQGVPLANVGFRTPSLRNVWATSPYLHDGSAATIADVLQNTVHVGALSASEKTGLQAYLSRLDAAEPAPASCPTSTATGSNYNVMAFGSASLVNGESHGSVGVGGSASLSSYSVASRVTGVTARLITGGSASWTNGSVGTGGSGVIRVAGAAAIGQSVGRSSLQSGVSVENWNALRAQQNALSDRLAAMPGTPGVMGSGNSLTCTGTNANWNVCTVTSTQLSQAQTLNLNYPATSSVLVNVTGGAATVRNGQMTWNGQPLQGNAAASQVIVNMAQMGGLVIEAWGWGGTLLAPRATLTHRNSAIDGQVIVSTLSATASYRCSMFMGTLP